MGDRMLLNHYPAGVFVGGGDPEPPSAADRPLSAAARDVLLLAASGCDLGADHRTPTTVEVVGWLAEGGCFRRPVPAAVLAELRGRNLVRRMPQHSVEWYEVTAAGRAWVAASFTLGG
jgi:hypothetical protein